MIKVEWTGVSPTLCMGNWHIFIDGVDYSDKIPEKLRRESMKTYGKYSKWHFDSSTPYEVWETYKDGLDEEDWIEENNYWLSTITNDYNIKCGIYRAIQEQDWRFNSCGGCI